MVSEKKIEVDKKITNLGRDRVGEKREWELPKKIQDEDDRKSKRKTMKAEERRWKKRKKRERKGRKGNGKEAGKQRIKEMKRRKN